MFIGPKKIKGTELVEGDLTLVQYEDGTTEVFSRRMFGAIQSEEPCDLTTLREKRITPIVKDVLIILRDWGIRLSELPYMSAVLNDSLMQNEKEALIALWKPWMPTMQSADDVDLVTVDRVLKARGAVPSPLKFNENDGNEG